LERKAEELVPCRLKLVVLESTVATFVMSRDFSVTSNPTAPILAPGNYPWG